MLGYLLRRLLLIIPTLLCILLVNFFIVQAAPGGPVEQAIARLQGIGGASASVGSAPAESVSNSSSRAARGLDPKLIKDIEHQYGFDKPLHERLWLMLKNYAQLDFGNSFFRGASVTDLILQKMPVSISLGLWATLLTYLVSIPLGIRKAVSTAASSTSGAARRSLSATPCRPSCSPCCWWWCSRGALRSTGFRYAGWCRRISSR